MIGLYIFLVMILSSTALALQTSDQSISSYKQFLDQQTKYINQGTLEYVTFYAQDGCNADKKIERTGVLLKRPQAKGIVLICHGFMCNKFDVGFIRTIFPQYHVMTFDFRAHGERVDEQQCCTFGRDEAHDVVAAVNFIKSRDDLATIPRIAYGFSMGAVAAIQAQANDPQLFNAMVLDCPFDHSDNVIKKGLENMKLTLFGYTFSIPGRSLLEKYAYHPYVQSLLKAVLKTISNMDATSTNTHIQPVSPAESVKKITVLCFFIHCKNDEKVVSSAAMNLFTNAGGYKRLWLTEGRRHFDSFFFNPEKYIYKVNTFINSIVDGTYVNKKREKIIDEVVGKNELIQNSPVAT